MQEDWQGHLIRTSRTFALAIPLLPAPLDAQVTLAYLLFRVADTLEDAHAWSAAKRASSLDDLAALLHTPDDSDLAQSLSETWASQDLSKHEGYVRLVSVLPALLRDLSQLGPTPSDIIISHVQDTAKRMARFVRQASPSTGIVQLQSIDELKDYCYAVAGIVGVMLTRLFLAERPELADAASVLRRTDVAYGEGLQLVNILKDSADDAKEGRVFIPQGSERAELFDLARGDLQAARSYIQTIADAGSPTGLVQFVTLPAALAEATLDKVERFGPRAKLSREEVTNLLAAVSLG